MDLCAEVDLEVLGVVKHVQESAALVKLGDAEEKVQKLERSKNLILEQIRPHPLNDNSMGRDTERTFSGMSGLHKSLRTLI